MYVQMTTSRGIPAGCLVMAWQRIDSELPSTDYGSNLARRLGQSSDVPRRPVVPALFAFLLPPCLCPSFTATRPRRPRPRARPASIATRFVPPNATTHPFTLLCPAAIHWRPFLGPTSTPDTHASRNLPSSHPLTGPLGPSLLHLVCVCHHHYAPLGPMSRSDIAVAISTLQPSLLCNSQ